MGTDPPYIPAKFGDDTFKLEKVLDKKTKKLTTIIRKRIIRIIIIRIIIKRQKVKPYDYNRTSP